MDKINAPKGTKDIFAPDVEKWQFLEDKVREIFNRFYFSEIRTPVFEHTELFSRGIGSETEVVSKEMYTFKDRKARSLTLRPENTASVVRAAIENRLLDLHFPLRYYYIGPMFRYERPQKGRQRQFHQFGIEVFNDATAEVDAEVILVAYKLLTELSITNIRVEINSVGCKKCRPDYLKLLSKEAGESKENLCPDCNRKSETNPLRIFDCKNKTCIEVADKFPKITEHLCDECKTHFNKLKETLDIFEVPYFVNNKLVRGLDYYTKTAFEITSDALGSQNAILGGGRYNNLIGELGGKDIGGIGFAAGMERVILHLNKIEKSKELKVIIMYHSEQEKKAALSIARECWKNGLKTFIDYNAQNIKKQFKKGDKIEADYAFIIGNEEVFEGIISIKNMKTREQEKIKNKDLEKWIKTKN
jgi:histidyl-tRNA synthetase